MKIIALLGRSRTGKDTAAVILSKTLAFPIVRLSSPIKDACHLLFDIPREDLDSAKKEDVDPRYGKTPRDIMVHLTASVRKDFPPDFFVTRLLSRCDQTTCDGIIIPDVRYEPDVKLLKRHGALVLKIERAHSPVVHAHENSIDALCGDATLKNDGDLHMFEKRIECLADCLKRALASE